VISAKQKSSRTNRVGARFGGKRLNAADIFALAKMFSSLARQDEKSKIFEHFFIRLNKFFVRYRLKISHPFFFGARNPFLTI